MMRSFTLVVCLGMAAAAGAAQAHDPRMIEPGLLAPSGGAVAPSLVVAQAGDVGQAQGRREAREMSRDEAVAMVQKRLNARVVRAETVDEDGRHIYVMRLLSEGGKVWTVRVDAASGAVR